VPPQPSRHATSSASEAYWTPAGRPGFEGLQVTSHAAGQTTVAGPVVDQAALHGLLAKVRDLGLELLSVRRLDPDR
jgi:hypothetical protein